MQIPVILLFCCGDIELNPGPCQVSKPNSLSICHVNIRSLNTSHLRAIKASLSHIYDVITISETMLCDSSDIDLTIPGYHPILRRDRNNQGGGIAVYIRDSIGFKRLYEAESHPIEIMWIKINTTCGNLLLATAYRPPSCDNFWEHIDSNIDHVRDAYDIKHIVLLGDLNADFNTVHGRHLNDLCVNHSFTCHIQEPTRITATSKTCLDQIISNIPNLVTGCLVTPPVSNNDHCTVSIKLNMRIPKERCYKRQIWKYSEGNYAGFRAALETADWEHCFVNNDIEEACSKWTDLFLKIASEFIPVKIVTVRPNDQPWYTNTLRLLRRRVKRLFHCAKKGNKPCQWDRYKHEMSNYKNMLDEAEDKYKMKLGETLTESRNSKKWWGTVKSMLGKGSDDSYPAMINNIDNSFVTDNRAKAALFNSFFLSHCNIDTNNANLPNVKITNNDTTIDEITASEAEVLDLLKSLDPQKATGPDGISSRLLKEAGASIVSPLTKLINLSLSSSKVPSLWKKANIIPIHKKGDKDQTNNYRPISLLSITSKILERIVFKHLYNFLHTNKLLTKFQSGFITGDSTINQLAFLYHTFCEALDHKKDIRVVFCDISKAFDKVWHDGLTHKLKKIGVRGKLLTWFKDYLNFRQQRVIIRGQSSDWGEIKAGVPQGSVLGPLLFLIYINDLVDGIKSDIRLFADDTTVYLTVDHDTNPNTSRELALAASQQLNTDLTNIKHWADQWLVNFNASKTKTMTISNRKLEHPPLHFDHSELDTVQQHKHLGLTFTSTLSWSPHISSMVTSASKVCQVLRGFKHFMDRKSLETIYFTFIRPKLEYACQIWDNCTISDKEALEKVQLLAARIVTGAKKGTSHVLLHQELHWPSLSERRNHIKLQFMQKIVHSNTPSYLSDLLPESADHRFNLRTTSSNCYRQYKTRTEKFKGSLFPDLIRLWNNLDAEMKLISDIAVFKAKVVGKVESNPLFYFGTRKANIIHSQLRMHCSNLKSHLVELHVIDDAMCTCGMGVEDNEHFFMHCPLYHDCRHNLSQALGNLSAFTINVILFGDDHLQVEQNCIIFEAVHKYILVTQRF